MTRKGIGGHAAPNRGATNDWITPKWLLDRLGRFDIDPCECIPQPWPCARKGFTVRHDGLKQRWRGRIYCNPPYGTEAAPFLERMAEHANGISLIFARTETRMFADHVWQQADAIMFLLGRLHFHYPTGKRAAGNSGGPSILIAYGNDNVEALRQSGLAGALVTKWQMLENDPSQLFEQDN